MDYSDFNYSAYDYLHEFPLSDIAHGFSRIGEDKNIRASMKNVITKALRQAILNGSLISNLQINDESPDSTRIDWSTIRIQRRELEKWFESRNDKPPFLFPEARNRKVVRKSRDNQEEQLDPRERTTLLQIIAVLAAEAELDLTKHSKAAEILQKMGAEQGKELPKKKDTIADKLKDARDLQKTR